MKEGETVNSRIDPTRVGQIKPLWPDSAAPQLREIVGISKHFPGGDKSLPKLDVFNNCWTLLLLYFCFTH